MTEEIKQPERLESEEVIELRETLKKEKLKLEILQTKANYSALKSAMNQTDGKEDKTLPIEEF